MHPDVFGISLRALVLSSKKPSSRPCQKKLNVACPPKLDGAAKEKRHSSSSMSGEGVSDEIIEVVTEVEKWLSHHSADGPPLEGIRCPMGIVDWGIVGVAGIFKLLAPGRVAFVQQWYGASSDLFDHSLS